jgi:hypothetical protein
MLPVYAFHDYILGCLHAAGAIMGGYAETYIVQRFQAKHKGLVVSNICGDLIGMNGVWPSIFCGVTSFLLYISPPHQLDTWFIPLHTPQKPTHIFQPIPPIHLHCSVKNRPLLIEFRHKPFYQLVYGFLKPALLGIYHENHPLFCGELSQGSGALYAFLI